MSVEPGRELFERDTSNVLRDSVTNLVEGITGIASSEKRELILSVGHIFQKLRAGQFLASLIGEWERYREKGRVKQDYTSTEQHKACLQELLDFLDKDIPDETRFSVIKQIFLTAATEEITDRTSHLPLQYMRIARTVSSGEILVLLSTFRVAGQPDKSTSHEGSAHEWLRVVAEESGLKYPELVETHERRLIEKALLMAREFRDGSGIKTGKHYRLTNLGYELCQYVTADDNRDEHATTV